MLNSNQDKKRYNIHSKEQLCKVFC